MYHVWLVARKVPSSLHVEGRWRVVLERSRSRISGDQLPSKLSNLPRVSDGTTEIIDTKPAAVFQIFCVCRLNSQA